ncbi:MAG TPA: PSD1 and planctomycete cytochrome C domain-containing protein [Opitutaceae bacterium]|nr:PSD1 and planctomycete cytochrome C domain-containing protein [Opitutaceae bacterium]
MRARRASAILAAAALAGTLRAAGPGPAAPLSAADAQFFEARIRPVLVERCYKCHSHDADRVKGGLMLDTQEGMLHGGDTGPAIEPGKPDDSLLIDAVRYTDDNLQMPPKGDKLSEQQISDLVEWIRRGAPDPRNGVAKGSSAAYGGVGRQHWSFLPLTRPAVPAVQDEAWCRTPIDRFVRQKLEDNGMQPNPEADKRTLIRRVTFDLVGLPPTEDEVKDFLADDSPDAYAKVVDRLLASPHYGERWARYWLDVARYADTKGDPVRKDDPRLPNAWTYRDYVINAFNDDKPYNQFIVEQLAADKVVLAAAKARPAGGAPPGEERLAAMGFLTLGPQFEGSVNDIINDRIDVTTKAFLGLTVTCARCHDHKFDPIPTKDYYSLYNVFANTFEPKDWEMPFVHPVAKTPALVAYLAQMDALDQRERAVEDQLKNPPKGLLRGMDREQRQKRRRELEDQKEELQRQIEDAEESPEAPPRAEILTDTRSGLRDYPVLIRGEAQNKGPTVPRQFLEILAGPRRQTWERDGGRLELAEAIADPKNPLTARVLVNRIWQQHFGVGFVPTPDDLGNQSAPPTHPELLDYLAGWFIQHGWSIKQLQREIVLSAVYRETSAGNPRYQVMDPDNHYLWRYNLRRLDFEEIHDELLSIAGTLDLGAVGGRSVPIGSAEFTTRRALYTYLDRRNPPEILTQFDFPNPNAVAGRRYATDAPQQSLFLMNSPLVVETARKLVHRPDFLELTTDQDRVSALYEAIFQRLPRPAEVQLCLRYVKANPDGEGSTVQLSDPRRQQALAQANRAAEQQARLAERVAGGGARRKNAPQVEAGAAAFRSRAPPDAWTKLAHALFQTNEAIFVN